MKRIFKSTVLILSLLACFVFASCGGGGNAAPVEDTDKGQYLDAEDGKTAADYSAKENLYIAANVLTKAGSFRTETEGDSRTNAGVSNLVLSKRTVKDGVVFKESRSYSSLVKLASQTYVSGNNLCR